MLLRLAVILWLVLAAPARATYSIVARDPATGDIGIAVASRVLAVGAIVPGARAGVGGVATQAYANPTYVPRGLELLAAGSTPASAITSLTAADARASERQVGIVDARGRAHAFTGSATLAWAGHRTGDGYAIQGNILAGPRVLEEMEKAYLSTPGPLARRLLAALAAGERAGGDRRGRQSAALLVVRAGAGYAGLTDRMIDLRVDDAPEPVAELRRLLDVREALMRAR